MAKKFYVVWKGHQEGIFTDWSTCQKAVNGFPGAKYKSFPTREAAAQAYAGAPFSTPAATKKNASKKASSRGHSRIKTFNAEDIAQLSHPFLIYTDGACEPNPGEAGSGIAVYHNGELQALWYGLYRQHSTNNVAELSALEQALIFCEQHTEDSAVAILCDSQYSIQCITQWAVSWEKNGWKKKDGEIKNLALIQSIYARYQALKQRIEILHVNGHVGVEGNELADRMSVHAIDNKETEFAHFREELSISEVLAMRTG